MGQCTTTRGSIRCDKLEGHQGDCEHQMPEYPQLAAPKDRDTQRELVRAAARIEVMRKALEEIRTAPCSDEKNGATCLCCLHDRMLAANALKVLE